MRDDPGIGRWPLILRDNHLNERQTSGKQSPCPLCGGKDRFRFDNKDGRGTWYCNHYGAGDGYILMMRMLDLDFRTVVAKIRETYGAVPPEPTKKIPNSRNQLNKLWASALRNSRELRDYMVRRSLPEAYADQPVLKYHPFTPWTDGDHKGKSGAMLAKVYQDGKPVSVLRTFLNGGPSMRKMMMSPVSKLDGCYIPLLSPKCGAIVGIAEGIETALSCREMQKDLGLPPHLVWSSYCSDQMIRFRPPKGVEKVFIYGDNDANYTGQSAAYRLAARLSREGFTCDVIIPAKAGFDWNDVHREKDCSSVHSRADGNAPAAHV
jgi:putative DNA primase/helicase